jgi:hypothetical protein
MAHARTFGYPWVRRWAFLLLAAGNIPVVYLAVRVSLLGPDLDWVVYILCANIVLGPLGVQLVRLSREMIVTVNECGVSGRSFFGRQVDMPWPDVNGVFRVLLPMRVTAMVVVSRSGGEKITFGEAIDDVGDLLALIKERGGSASQSSEAGGPAA